MDKDLQIVVMGNVASRNFFPKDINIKNLGFISSPEELSKAYSNVDLYIIPSIEDNLPNTIIESHMCGTPVVGFKKAGVANMIKDGFNGVLVDEIDGKGLANGIIRALDMINNKAFLHDEILNSSKSYYSEKKVVELYNDIYKSHYS